MLLRGEIQRDTPCRQGVSGRWLTVYDHVPSARWGRSLRNIQASAAAAEEPRAKSHFRAMLLIVSIICGTLALVLLVFLLNNIAPSPPPSHVLNPSVASGSESFGPVASLFVAFMTIWGVLVFLGMIAIILSPLLFAFWLWMLIALLTREPPSHDKTVWVIVVVFTGPLGALLYALIRYRSPKREPS